MINPKTDETESSLEQLTRKVWTTKGARLEAARRLERRGNASSWVILLSSLVLVTLSIALLFPSGAMPGSMRALAESGSVVGAVAILLVGIVERGKSYELKVDRHHRAAMQLNQLLDEVKIAESKSVEEGTEEYHRIVQSFHDNHEPIDYYLFAVKNRDSFCVSWYEPVRVHVWWHVVAYWPWLILGAAAFGFTVLLQLKIP